MKTLTNPYEQDQVRKVDPYSRLVAYPVQAQNIFHFPEGVPAFEQVKEFVFLSKPDSRPFLFMQALRPQDLSFVCIDPFLIDPDYAPRISDADAKFLHLNAVEDALVLCIVTVARDVTNTTANLQAPLVININACMGKQIICDGQNYPVRYRIWDALDNIETMQRENRASEQVEVSAKG